MKVLAKALVFTLGAGLSFTAMAYDCGPTPNLDKIDKIKPAHAIKKQALRTMKAIRMDLTDTDNKLCEPNVEKAVRLLGQLILPPTFKKDLKVTDTVKSKVATRVNLDTSLRNSLINLYGALLERAAQQKLDSADIVTWANPLKRVARYDYVVYNRERAMAIVAEFGGTSAERRAFLEEMKTENGKWVFSGSYELFNDGREYVEAKFSQGILDNGEHIYYTPVPVKLVESQKAAHRYLIRYEKKRMSVSEISKSYSDMFLEIEAERNRIKDLVDGRVSMSVAADKEAMEAHIQTQLKLNENGEREKLRDALGGLNEAMLAMANMQREVVRSSSQVDGDRHPNIVLQKRAAEISLRLMSWGSYNGSCDGYYEFTRSRFGLGSEKYDNITCFSLDLSELANGIHRYYMKDTVDYIDELIARYL